MKPDVGIRALLDEGIGPLGSGGQKQEEEE